MNMRIDHVRPAYQQVSDQLRTLILQGELAPGTRLPNEPELSVMFGVSRSTLREALRALSSQSLITTQRGVTGGSFVAHPNPADVSEFLEASIALLSGAQVVSVAELLEARSLLEVPAARLAAERRSDGALDEMRAAVEEEERSLDGGFEGHRALHAAILQACGNGLINMLTRPLFTVLRTRFLRDQAPRAFWRQVAADHRVLVERIAEQDVEGAAREMAAHLDRLRTTYERVDRMARRREEGSIT